MKKILTNIFYIFGCLVLAWILVSWAEVVLFNMSHHSYWPLNAFVLITRIGQ